MKSLILFTSNRLDILLLVENLGDNDAIGLRLIDDEMSPDFAAACSVSKFRL